MAKVLEQLTDAACKRLTKPGLHVDGGGLYLSVTPRKDGSVTRSWVVRYTAPDGRRREMGLGGYPEVSLAAARRLAAVKRDEVRAGGDPVAAKVLARREAAQAAAKATTFRECCETFTAAHEACWRNAKHAKQWSATLKTYAYPVFGDWPVSTIDTSAVVKALDAIWLEKPETARRVRGRIERVLDWAKVRGHREGENPARWRGHLDKALPVIPKAQRIKHHAALPFEQTGVFMAQLRAIPGVAARALEFAILTAARTGEVLGARWKEIDLKGRVWIIPAARMKARREHRVPLNAGAIALLQRLRSVGKEEELPDHVFVNEITRAQLSNMAMLMTLRRMGRRDLTAHGFRSTFRDWTAEQTDFAREVAEAALAHAIGSEVEAAYRRGDLFEKRRRLMEMWGSYCCYKLSTTAHSESTRA